MREIQYSLLLGIWFVFSLLSCESSHSSIQEEEEVKTEENNR